MFDLDKDWSKALLWSALGAGSLTICRLAIELFKLRSIRIQHEKAKIYTR
jgi:hypothetical protein